MLSIGRRRDTHFERGSNSATGSVFAKLRRDKLLHRIDTYPH